MLLVTNLLYKSGRTNILPEVGVVTFDEKAQLEVEASQGLFLLELMPEFSEVVAPEALAPPVVPPVEVVPPVDPGAQSQLVALQKGLTEHTTAELKKVAESNEFPAEEWEKLKKVDLIKYLEEKYQLTA